MAVFSRNNILYIEFTSYTPDNRRMRCRETTHLKDNKRNRSICNDKFKAIQYELAHGKFDYLRFFPNGAKAHLFGNKKSSTTLKDFWDVWISEKTVRAGTMRNYIAAYTQSIGPHFGHYLLTDIDEHEVLVFRKMLIGKGLKHSTINNNYMKALSGCLGTACRRGYLTTNPCEGMPKLKESRVEIDPYTPSELNKLLDTLFRKKMYVYHNMITLWIYTGLRTGEMFALKWKHVDFDNNQLLIRETRHPNGSEGPPKTESSIRNITLDEYALQAILNQKPLTRLAGKYIFLSPTHGGPVNLNYFHNKLEFMCGLARIKYRTPKQFRHTFASLALGAGEQILWVSQVMGHSNSNITLQRYARFIPNLTHNDGSALKALLNKGRPALKKPL